MAKKIPNTANKPLGAHYEVGRVAILLDMSPRWVRDRIEAGDLEGYRFGNKIVVTAASLDTFLFNRKIQSTSTGAEANP